VSALIGGDLAIPVVVRVGGRYWYLRHRRSMSAMARESYLQQLRFVFGSADCLAFNAHSLRRLSEGYFQELGIDPAGEQVVLDTGVAAPPDDAGGAVGPLANALHGDAPLVACVGKLKSDSKRQDVLIRALPLLPDRRARLAVAGDGPTRETLQELARQQGVGDRILFLGSLHPSEVFQLLRRADVFAHATDFEGSSKAVAEAMVAAKPVVASDIPALREHIRHHENGLLAANEPVLFAREIARRGGAQSSSSASTSAARAPSRAPTSSSRRQSSPARALPMARIRSNCGT
jgi:glycosyltransferase involved in cell wall biosynthesis